LFSNATYRAVIPEEPLTASNLEALVAATPEELAEALPYALRYDERGKPRRGGWVFMAGLAAESLVNHLQRSGFVILRAHPERPHSAG
jgi:hypothetical protein